VLNKVVGAGKVIARVETPASIRRSSQTTEEEVNADGAALKSQQTEDELLDGARTNPTGIPGTRSNLPGAEDTGQVGSNRTFAKN